MPARMNLSRVRLRGRPGSPLQADHARISIDFRLGVALATTVASLGGCGLDEDSGMSNNPVDGQDLRALALQREQVRVIARYAGRSKPSPRSCR